ncbi:MAG: PKD domain-containing protein [Ignavibacteria bacterium]|nr:PKD domain-containing protein [Ignavibacteria bacterium]
MRTISKKLKVEILFIFVLLCFSCENNIQVNKYPNNHPPVIDSITVTFDLISLVPAATIICFAKDPDGDSLSYKWKASAGEFYGSGHSVYFIIPPCCETFSHKVTVEVYDPYDGNASRTISIRPPKIGF